MSGTGFMNGVRRELRRMGSRRVYLIGMVLIPLAVTLFFVSLMSRGVSERVPNAIVDLDQSPMSRSLHRTLASSQLVDIVYEPDSYSRALELVRSGEIFGFFVIPADFERDALSGRTPTLEYYSNMTYFVPGTFTFKGFKTVAVTASGGLARSTLVSLGADPEQIGGLLMPVSVDICPIGNPWANYAVYLAPSFTMATFALMIMLMTVLAVTDEIKHGTSRRWLEVARGRMSVALLSKLLPHTFVYFCVGLFILWVFFGWQHFPMNGSLWWMIAATFLLVMATQSFAVLVCGALPNPRLSFSACALFGVLTYSFAGFSMPVPSMYGAIGVFSWLAPVRYWFLIFAGDALNGVPVYYFRWYFVALIGFMILPVFIIPRLRKAMSDPVYVP